MLQMTSYEYKCITQLISQKFCSFSNFQKQKTIENVIVMNYAHQLLVAILFVKRLNQKNHRCTFCPLLKRVRKVDSFNLLPFVVFKLFLK